MTDLQVPSKRFADRRATAIAPRYWLRLHRNMHVFAQVEKNASGQNARPSHIHRIVATSVKVALELDIAPVVASSWRFPALSCCGCSYKVISWSCSGTNAGRRPSGGFMDRARLRYRGIKIHVAVPFGNAPPNARALHSNKMTSLFLVRFMFVLKSNS